MAENVLWLCAEIARINQSNLPETEKEKLKSVILDKIKSLQLGQAVTICEEKEKERTT